MNNCEPYREPLKMRIEKAGLNAEKSLSRPDDKETSESKRHINLAGKIFQGVYANRQSMGRIGFALSPQNEKLERPHMSDRIAFIERDFNMITESILDFAYSLYLTDIQFTKEQFAYCEERLSKLEAIIDGPLTDLVSTIKAYRNRNHHMKGQIVDDPNHVIDDIDKAEHTLINLSFGINNYKFFNEDDPKYAEFRSKIQNLLTKIDLIRMDIPTGFYWIRTIDRRLLSPSPIQLK